MHDPRTYRYITLPSHMLKLLERILDDRIRAIVEGDEHHGFRKGGS